MPSALMTTEPSPGETVTAVIEQPVHESLVRTGITTGVSGVVAALSSLATGSTVTVTEAVEELTPSVMV